MRIWIPLAAWTYVSCERCVLLGRSLCVGLITRPEESYRVWCVWGWLWSLENEKAWATRGCCAMGGKTVLLSLVRYMLWPICKYVHLMSTFNKDQHTGLKPERAPDDDNACKCLILQLPRPGHRPEQSSKLSWTDWPSTAKWIGLAILCWSYPSPGAYCQQSTTSFS